MKVYTIINIFDIGDSTECAIYNFSDREKAENAFLKICEKRKFLHENGLVYIENDKLVTVNELFKDLLGGGYGWCANNPDNDKIFIRNEECDTFDEKEYE